MTKSCQSLETSFCKTSRLRPAQVNNPSRQTTVGDRRLQPRPVSLNIIEQFRLFSYYFSVRSGVFGMEERRLPLRIWATGPAAELGVWGRHPRVLTATFSDNVAMILSESGLGLVAFDGEILPRVELAVALGLSAAGEKELPPLALVRSRGGDPGSHDATWVAYDNTETPRRLRKSEAVTVAKATTSERANPRLSIALSKWITQAIHRYHSSQVGALSLFF